MVKQCAVITKNCPSVTTIFEVTLTAGCDVTQLEVAAATEQNLCIVSPPAALSNWKADTAAHRFSVYL